MRARHVHHGRNCSPMFAKSSFSRLHERTANKHRVLAKMFVSAPDPRTNKQKEPCSFMFVCCSFVCLREQETLVNSVNIAGLL